MSSIVLDAEIHGCIQRSIGPDQSGWGLLSQQLCKWQSRGRLKPVRKIRFSLHSACINEAIKSTSSHLPIPLIVHGAFGTLDHVKGIDEPSLLGQIVGGLMLDISCEFKVRLSGSLETLESLDPAYRESTPVNPLYKEPAPSPLPSPSPPQASLPRSLAVLYLPLRPRERTLFLLLRLLPDSSSVRNVSRHRS